MALAWAPSARSTSGMRPEVPGPPLPAVRPGRPHQPRRGSPAGEPGGRALGTSQAGSPPPPSAVTATHAERISQPVNFYDRLREEGAEGGRQTPAVGPPGHGTWLGRVCRLPGVHGGRPSPCPRGRDPWPAPRSGPTSARCLETALSRSYINPKEPLATLGNKSGGGGARGRRTLAPSPAAASLLHTTRGMEEHRTAAHTGAIVH